MKWILNLLSDDDTRLFILIMSMPFLFFFAIDFLVVPLVLEIFSFLGTYIQYRSIAQSVNSGRYLAIESVNFGSPWRIISSLFFLTVVIIAFYYLDHFGFINYAQADQVIVMLIGLVSFIHGIFSNYIKNVIITDEYLNLKPLGIKEGFTKLSAIQQVIIRKNNITVRNALNMYMYDWPPKAEPHRESLINALKSLLGDKVRIEEE